MKIDTKYDIGQMVYAITEYEDRYYVRHHEVLHGPISMIGIYVYGKTVDLGFQVYDQRQKVVKNGIESYRSERAIKIFDSYEEANGYLLAHYNE